jgi:predicted dienelactone hydrolase
MMRVWNRATDLSFALDRLLEQDFFRSRIDLTKVAAAGHSAGGATVLLLAGARLSSAKLTSPIPTCSGTKDPFFAKVCDEAKSIDAKSYPKQIVEADYSDARVKAVVALDPGFDRSFRTESFKYLKSKPMLFLAGKMNTSHDQILAKEFSRYFPTNEVEIVPDSFHMTFLQACKSDYPKDYPELAELCVENDKKIQIQKRVADLSLEFFKKSWGQSGAQSL